MKQKNIYNNENPLFFLFTCVKDGRKYINKLFDSLLSQTKINFVHYIYEDGSADPIEDLVDIYKEKVSKLSSPYKVVYEKNPINIGLNMATRHCIDMCNLPYFIWIDCDNYIDNNYFDELEKLYLKSKESLLLRSVIYKAEDPTNISFCNCGTVDNAKTKHQIGLFLRRKYYYSFFAVNYKKYKAINPRNIMLKERLFFNDEQILILCLLNCEKAPISTNAKGYFSTHNNQESSNGTLPISSLRFHQLELCNSINFAMKAKLEAMYRIKDLYDELFKCYQSDFRKSLRLIKHIRAISRDNNISLKNFYDYCLLKQTIRVYFWRIKLFFKGN